MPILGRPSQHGVQDDVDDGAGGLDDHGLGGPAGGLEQPLAEHLDKDTHRQQAADAGIGDASLHGLRHGGLHLIVGPNAEAAEKHENGGGNAHEQKALTGCPVGGFLILAAQALGQQGVYAHTDAHGKTDLHILHRKGQAQGGHRAFGHLGNIDAVHDVVKGLHQHGNDHRQGHVDQKLSNGHYAHFVLSYGFCLHERFFLSNPQ